MVNERAKRGNLLGSSLKLTGEENGKHFPAGPDPETARGSKSLPEKTLCRFQVGSQLCRECLKEPSLIVLGAVRTQDVTERAHTHTHTYMWVHIPFLHVPSCMCTH